MKGMCKELGRFSQGYGEKGSDEYIKGTNRVFFMDLDQIKNIPEDQVVTYTQIVVNYQPPKKDPHCVRITAGGNLTEYPFELTTQTSDNTIPFSPWKFSNFLKRN